MPMDTYEKIQIGAAFGSIFFMLSRNDIPLWKKLAFCVIGFVAASLTTEALVDYFHFGVGMAGGIGFFAAVVVIPVANTLISFAENPAKIVDFVRGLAGAKKDGGGDGS